MESYATSCTASGEMNLLVKHRLRSFANQLRNAHAGGASSQELQNLKAKQMETMYRIVASHLGAPPKNFVWRYNDKQDGVEMTPLAFAKDVVKHNVCSSFF